MGEASALQNGSDGPARWSLRLFGDFQLIERASGEKVALPGKRERVLLAYLALSASGRQPRRKLVNLLWGEAADETTLDNLRTAVFNLRKALGDTDHRIIASEDRDIVLDLSAFVVDVFAFRRLAAGSGMAELEEAARLYAGDFLEGIGFESEEFESWRREEGTRCKTQALDALTRLMRQLAGSGEGGRAIEVGLRILRLEPLHEAAVRSLMRLYGGSGQRATAVELYRTLAESLKKELGARPEAETRAVYGEITGGNEGQIAAIGDVKSPPPTSMAQSVPSAAEHVFPAIGSTPIALKKVNRRKIGWLAGGLAAAMALLFFYQFAPSSDPSAQQSAGEAAKAAASSPATAVSIAVLPFANLSDDRQQEFFSDGMTEEITSALAKIPDLRVVGRTSAFQFKDQSRDLRAIGEALNATHLIEGSVRKEGDRVRITAQLVEASSGLHVWAQNYDRQLTGVLAIQEEIARAIAGALKMPLALQQGELLVAHRNIDPRSYEEYLRAAQMVRSRAADQLTEAAKRLEQVLARTPDYAPGWALLSEAYGVLPLNTPERVAGAVEEARAIYEASAAKAREAALRAIELDPSSARGYLNLGQWHIRRGERLVGMEIRAKAEALDPDNPDVLSNTRNNLAQMGYLKQALPISQRLAELEPFVLSLLNLHSRILFASGKIDEAIAIDAPRRNPSLAEYYAARGRYREAVSIIESLRVPPGLLELQQSALRVLRTAPAVARAPDSLPPLGGLSWIYLHVGAADRVMDYYEGNARIGYYFGGEIINLWAPPFAPVRKTERFKAYVRAAGMVEYWRAKGWPDLCRPIGADDFVCD